MNLFDIMLQTLGFLTLEPQKNKAEHPALYSDISQWDFPQTVFESAYLSLNAACLLPFLGLNCDNEERLRNQLSRLAHSKGLQGRWSLVERLVRQEPYTPAAVLNCLVQEVGPHAFFGNHIKSMRRIYKNMKVKNPYEPSTSPVRKPQRKSGYNDKGHLPLSHVVPKGRPTRERAPYQEITEESRFYSNTLVGDRSNIAAELMRKSTSRKKRTRRRKKHQPVARDYSKQYHNNQKVSKEEWHAIFNCNK